MIRAVGVVKTPQREWLLDTAPLEPDWAEQYWADANFPHLLGLHEGELVWLYPDAAGRMSHLPELPDGGARWQAVDRLRDGPDRDVLDAARVLLERWTEWAHG